MTGATINGFTAERMLAIEAASIVGARLEGNNLVLTKHDGTDISIGNIKGAAGTPGATGATGFGWFGWPSSFTNISELGNVVTVGSYIVNVGDSSKTMLGVNVPIGGVICVTSATTATLYGNIRGVAGATGAQGQVGATGAQGATGPAGVNGTNGTNGSNGVAPASTSLTTTYTSVNAGATVQGALSLGRAYRLEKVTATRACWIRLYASVAQRTADAGRSRTAEVAAGDHGLIAEIFLTPGVLSTLLLPAPHGYVVSGDTVYSVVNDGATGGLSFTFTEQVLEV